MILVYHNNSCIIKAETSNGTTIDVDDTKSIADVLMRLAQQFPKSKLVWCHQDLQGLINLVEMPEILHHQKMMVSYNPEIQDYFGSSIGYVEESPFINVNKKVSYPTWQMSSAVGVIEAVVLLVFKDKIKCDTDFDYYLSSVAKVGMSRGLLCYSDPKLLTRVPKINSPKATVFSLFKFVKQHYKTRWLFLLSLNLMIYESRFSFLAFIYALFFKNRNKLSISLENILVQSNRLVVEQATIDVIIPTIGRKYYLYDVLKDLAQQTHLPKNVIIVEQNPQQGTDSELDYLHTEVWPFIIKHTFTHQVGVCNARNLALSQVESEWVFLADDDIRIDNFFIQKGFQKINDFGEKVVNFKCFQKGDKQIDYSVFQWGTFGSGCSFVSADSLKDCYFKMNYEFGFGEDADFGMQLRNQGHDVLYFPDPAILHLKAPIGGFRTKPILAWRNEIIQPKPSPTVMLYKQLYLTKEQINGYKTNLFFKFYRVQAIKNPIRYLNNFRKQWKQSLYWANKIKK